MPTLFKGILLMVPRLAGSAGTSVLRNQFLAGLKYHIGLLNFLVCRMLWPPYSCGACRIWPFVYDGVGIS